MGVLICVDLIYSGVLMSMLLQIVGHNWATELNTYWAGGTFQVLFDIVQCDYSLPLEIVFLKGGPVWIPVWWFTLGHDWTEGVIYSPAGLVNMKSPTALCLKLLFWKTALRKYHCFLPHSGPQTLRPIENSVYGLSATVECARRNTQDLSLISPSPLPSVPRTYPSFLEHHSAEGAVICRWGDPKDGGWR